MFGHINAPVSALSKVFNIVVIGVDNEHQVRLRSRYESDNSEVKGGPVQWTVGQEAE